MEDNNVKPGVALGIAVICILIIGPLCFWFGKQFANKDDNKKEEKDLASSQYYPMLMDKYRSEKVMQQILSTFATVISSTFRVIDYENPEINGKIIDCIPAIVLEELQLMTLLY